MKEIEIKTTLRFFLLEWLLSRTQTTNIGKDVGEKAP
jgi:hypothetical protein